MCASARHPRPHGREAGTHLSAREAFELTVRHPVDVGDPLELFLVGMIDL